MEFVPGLAVNLGVAGMSFLAISTRVSAALVAIACAAGHVASAQEDADESTSGALPGLSASERTFADALAHYCRGLMAEVSDPGSGESLAELEEAFRLNPGQMDITLRLAGRYQSAGRTNDLLRVLQAGGARYPADINLHYYLGGVYHVTGQYDKALAEHGRLIQRHPENVAGYLGELQVYLQQKDEKKALAVVSDGLRNATNSEGLVTICRQFGAASVAAGDWDRGVKWFSLVRAAMPDDLSGFLMLLEAYLRKGDKAGAAALLLTTPAKYKDNPRFDYVVARHYLGTGNFKEAMERFERVEKSQGPLEGRDGLRDSVYYHQFGIACERSGHTELAEKQFEQSLEMDAKNAEALNYIAYMWAERAVNLDKALEYIKRALEDDKENPAYLDTLGWIYFKQGKTDPALAEISKAHALMPDEAVIADHMGDILQARKETGKAVAMWKASFMSDPGSRSVEKKLKEQGIDTDKLREEAKAARKARPAVVKEVPGEE